MWLKIWHQKAVQSTFNLCLGHEKAHACNQPLFCGYLVLITHSHLCYALMEQKTWSAHIDREYVEKPFKGKMIVLFGSAPLIFFF